MDDRQGVREQPPSRILAGALAHLEQHLTSGCPRGAYLASLLLGQIANDPQVDAALRQQAWQLAELLKNETTPPAGKAARHNAAQTADATRRALR